jgi:hypothetical protein
MYKETDIPLISEQYYHIYNCGNNGENLFFEERNYPYFLKLYAKYIYPVTNTYAYCLMKNHFHLLVRMKPLEDLEGFETFQVYTPDSFQICLMLTLKPLTKLITEKVAFFKKISNVN